MRCYLCGALENLTRDHIPPRGFFPPPRPSNLITVPCCNACNHLYSLDDEAVRLWLSAHLGASEAGEWIIKNRTAKTSHALLQSLRNTMKETKLLTVEEGEIEVTTYELPKERIDRFLIRITKGLLTHYFGEYDYSIAVFDVKHVRQTVDNLSKLEPLRDLLQYDYRGDDVFQYRGGLTDSKESGVWIFLFYGAVLFVVSHTKNNWRQNTEAAPFSKDKNQE
jgi:hypothetical protein